MLLADSAQADPSGKVHLLGLGWTRTGVPAGPMAVVVLLRLETTEEATQPHQIEFELVDEAGKHLNMSPDGKSLRLMAKVAPSPGAAVELPAMAPVVWQLGAGLPFAVDQTYTWRISVDGKQDDEWTVSFATHEP